MDDAERNILTVDDDKIVTTKKVLQFQNADEHSVHKLGLSEVRIMMFHANSTAFTEKKERTVDQFQTEVMHALENEVDFISGDGNQFVQRAFRHDSHSDYWTSCFVERVAACIEYLNEQSDRRSYHRITYNVVSSTQAKEWLNSVEGRKYDCDSMILISICYGKQIHILRDRMKKHEQMSQKEIEELPSLDNEYILNDLERFKYCENIDLGNHTGDTSTHSPLMVNVSMHPLKNFRHRTQKGLENRGRKFKEYQEKIGAYQEENYYDQSNYYQGPRRRDWEYDKEGWQRYDQQIWSDARYEPTPAEASSSRLNAKPKSKGQTRTPSQSTNRSRSRQVPPDVRDNRSPSQNSQMTFGQRSNTPRRNGPRSPSHPPPDSRSQTPVNRWRRRDGRSPTYGRSERRTYSQRSNREYSQPRFTRMPRGGGTSTRDRRGRPPTPPRTQRGNRPRTYYPPTGQDQYRYAPSWWTPYQWNQQYNWSPYYYSQGYWYY